MISILQDDEGSTSEKMDFSLFLPCSSFLISTPLSRYACGFYCYLFFPVLINSILFASLMFFLKSLFVMSFFCLSSARILRIFWEVELLFTRVLLRFVIFYTISCLKSLSLTMGQRWKGLGDWILQKHERREDLEPFHSLSQARGIEISSLPHALSPIMTDLVTFLSRLLFWVNIFRMKYSLLVVLVFSLLFGSPSVDVTRQKF